MLPKFFHIKKKKKEIFLRKENTMYQFSFKNQIRNSSKDVHS